MLRSPRTLRLGFCLPLLLVFLGFWDSSPSMAGLTASEVVVVVNGDSFSSRTLANHYIGQRNIPASNVIVLSDIPSSEVIPVAEFRSRILRPVLTEVDRRKLGGHVQCIAYSADFPTAIDISEDLEPLEDLPRIYTKRASINALTFLYASVLRGIPSYIQLDTNFYARRRIEDYFRNPGGEDTLESWQNIERAMIEERHEEAAKQLEGLLEKHPHQFPIAYLAAAQSALAGETDRAMQLLQRAVNTGWDAGGYLASDERFDSLRDRSDFQVIEFSLDAKLKEFQPSLGFDAQTAWTPNGIRVRQAPLGVRFMLSTVLGVTRGNGTTLNQAIDSIRRSAQADFQRPEGSFFFSVTSDVRSTTRKWGFLAASDNLREMGYQSELITTPLPRNQELVLGLQTGTPSFNWPQSGSQFVPGAIADNLTSFGGVMTAGSSQTKLSEFIKAGAAGSCGTVTEPFALQEKFPTPQLYVHYASGASLAEAFYMSVTGPYQLLIVGDPLCRPFSHAPKVNIDTELRRLDARPSLQIDLEPEGVRYADWSLQNEPLAKRTQRLAPVDMTVLFDGVRPQTSRMRRRVSIDMSGQPAGYHEITLQFIADDPLAQRSQQVLPVWIGPDDAITVRMPDAETKRNQQDGREFSVVSLRDESLRVEVSSPRAKRLTLWNQQEQVAASEGSEAELQVALSSLGRGPVRLQAKAELEDGTIIQSLPSWVRVDP